VCLTDPNAIDSSSALPSDDKRKGGRFSRKKKSGSKDKQSLNIAATSSSSPINSNSVQSKSRSPIEESMVISVPASAAPKSQFSMEENKSSTYNMAGDNHQHQSGMTGTGNPARTSPQSTEGFRSNEHKGSSNNPAVKRSISRTMSESTASSAMGSDLYINSLENIPATSSDSLLKTAKDFPVLNLQSDKKVKEALSREVGRNKIPAMTSIEQWSVRVSEPNWDDEEGRYKYKIKLTKNEGATEQLDTLISKSSLNEVTTTRSLQDFVWLERALRAEYHGGLITPLLSLTIYFASVANASPGDDILDTGSRMSSPVDNPPGMSWDATKATSQSIKFLGKILDQNETVNSNVLASWLSDVINGVRGDGEAALRYDVDILQSEALETFLFRHAEALNDVSPDQMGTNQKRASSLGGFDLFSFIGDNVGDGCYNNSILSLGDVIKTPFAVFDACAGSIDDRKNSPKRGGRTLYSSGATGVPGLNCDSILSESDFDDAWLLTSTPNSAAHSELLEAERDFITSSIKTSSDGISKVQSLVKHEEYVGKCWQNLATSLSGLFSVEKDIETAHIGDQIKSNKKKQPFRKLRKSAVNEVLLGLAQGKVDRARPGLILLGSMLSAYYTDLNSIVPSFKEFVDATRQLHELDEAHLIKDENANASSFDKLKSFIINTYQSNETTSRYTMEDEVQTIGSLNTTQSKALQRRVLSNEKMLKQSMTSICRGSALRRARMAWWYFKTEAKQAANVHATAVALRQALSIDADTAIAMKERRYAEDETKDNAAEIDLVKRILDLGKKNFSLSHNESSTESSPFSESSQAALNMAIDQVGRWDANAAQTILQAAGVEDAEVTIDETSRELRHVRKYAISLRESVGRCLEAVSALTSVWDSGNDARISKSRREFWAAMSTFFSGKVSKDLRNVRVLANAGVDTQDRGGWLGVKFEQESPLPQRRRCGEATKFYLKKRDSQAGILISRISKLLNEYERRLEGIECFVYMHIVGIQLEKHCSVVRAKSLSAWEKRTDISTAINVATKKKIPKLVEELRMKLDGLPQVSHTTVIKAKENHLASKTLKTDLHKLANRRLGRAQDVATERVIGIVSLWAKHEESVAMEEVKALGKAVQEVELSIEASDVDRNADDFSFISSVKKEEEELNEPNQESSSTSKGIGVNRTLMI